MHLYDALIIGSGYSSSGFALTKKNCIILEETQCCDTHFYLPLKSYKCQNYSPVTLLGKKLNSVFEKYNLFKDDSMCTNAFEPAFCQFLSGEDIDILLKCKVVNISELDDGTYSVTVINAEGLSTFYAKTVFDTTSKNTAKKYLTILFATENGADAIKVLSEKFPDAIFTDAFYETRYAMHLPANDISDVNEMISNLEDKWKTVTTDAKVLYVAPVFAPMDSENTDKFPKDFTFSNPIEAFEAGILFAGGNKE